MAIQQLTAFVENRRGRLVELPRLLPAAGVALRAHAVADTQEFGILRAIVSDTPKAMDILRRSGVLVKSTPVVGVRLTDRPGELSLALAALDEADINVEYLYAFLAVTPGVADLVLRVQDNDAAERVLREAGFEII